MSKADDLASLGVGLAVAGLAFGIMGKVIKTATKPVRKIKSIWF